MDNYSYYITKLSLENNSLKIGLMIKGAYSDLVRDPKISVIFDNGEEIRRLPLPVQAYLPSEDLQSFTIYAEYEYLINHLFLYDPVNDMIRFSFEFTYGDQIAEKVAFKIHRKPDIDEGSGYELSCMENNSLFQLSVLSGANRMVQGKRKGLILGFVNIILHLVFLAFMIPLLFFFIMEAVLYTKGYLSENEYYKGKRSFTSYLMWRMNSFAGNRFGMESFKTGLMRFIYRLGCQRKIRPRQITFISNRRDDLSGNFQFVYDILKKDETLEIKFILDKRPVKKMSLSTIWKYGWYMARSGVVLVDDFTKLVYTVQKREQVTIIQLWHACGAFKTFGYSRLGGDTSLTQESSYHRNYDHAIVSSREIAKFYAEGFGISPSKVIDTGVPRTDIFFDEKYKASVKEKFYTAYPQMRDKKIILFAPTFRGEGQNNAHYPNDLFSLESLYKEFGGEYGIIIKHHPYIKEKVEIPAEYGDVMIDLSNNSEINELLFVTDLLITDYSSVVFEASLLNIPMLFYAFDLEEYISDRGFYYEYTTFVPGKIVTSFDEIRAAIKDKNFEEEKITGFKRKFFSDLDGKSAQRAADLIYKSLG